MKYRVCVLLVLSVIGVGVWLLAEDKTAESIGMDFRLVQDGEFMRYSTRRRALTRVIRLIGSNGYVVICAINQISAC